jgi:hypothetical protein
MRNLTGEQSKQLLEETLLSLVKIYKREVLNMIHIADTQERSRSKARVIELHQLVIKLLEAS